MYIQGALGARVENLLENRVLAEGTECLRICLSVRTCLFLKNVLIAT